jgi:hypothetical protein
MTASTTASVHSAAATSVPAVPAFKKKEPVPEASVKVTYSVRLLLHLFRR